MAAVSPGRASPKTVVLSTALQLVTPVGTCRFVYLSCSAIVYLEYGGADGGVLGTHYFPIPANTLFPIEVAGPAICIAAASGTPTAHLLGVE